MYTNIQYSSYFSNHTHIKLIKKSKTKKLSTVNRKYWVTPCFYLTVSDSVQTPFVSAWFYIKLYSNQIAKTEYINMQTWIHYLFENEWFHLISIKRLLSIRRLNPHMFITTLHLHTGIFLKLPLVLPALSPTVFWSSW